MSPSPYSTNTFIGEGGPAFSAGSGRWRYRETIQYAPGGLFDGLILIQAEVTEPNGSVVILPLQFFYFYDPKQN
jgi:hypothetical protein